MAGGGRPLLALLLVLCCLLPAARAQEGAPGEGSGVVINLPPPAEDEPDFVVIVVDVQRILEEAQALRQLQDQLAEARQAFQTVTRHREAELRERDRTLAADRDRYEAEEFQEKRDQLAQDLAALQEDIRSWFRTHDQVLNQAMRQAQEQLLRIVGELARERGASLVLPRASVLLVQSDLDITEEVLQRLNAEMPALPPPVLPAPPDGPSADP